MTLFVEPCLCTLAVLNAFVCYQNVTYWPLHDTMTPSSGIPPHTVHVHTCMEQYAFTWCGVYARNTHTHTHTHTHIHTHIPVLPFILVILFVVCLIVIAHKPQVWCEGAPGSNEFVQYTSWDNESEAQVRETCAIVHVWAELLPTNQPGNTPPTSWGHKDEGWTVSYGKV